ncbi:unnamed protein product [Leptidea sinapis]|uniref:Condensin complex subunit 1 C-terminal domain-containing protein n=1 Tax=Leptidea sinapis TaxID=189913 RepID=A0A5E4QAN4_9NEOP|nr:unnamed protein product [Leptidea sinapis]
MRIHMYARQPLFVLQSSMTSRQVWWKIRVSWINLKICSVTPIQWLLQMQWQLFLRSMKQVFLDVHLLLLTALNECTEWGQVFILDALSNYSPWDSREAHSICERITPRLAHANAAVVLSAVKKKTWSLLCPGSSHHRWSHC